MILSQYLTSTKPLPSQHSRSFIIENIYNTQIFFENQKTSLRYHQNFICIMCPPLLQRTTWHNLQSIAHFPLTNFNADSSVLQEDPTVYFLDYVVALLIPTPIPRKLVVIALDDEVRGYLTIAMDVAKCMNEFLLSQSSYRKPPEFLFINRLFYNFQNHTIRMKTFVPKK